MNLGIHPMQPPLRDVRGLHYFRHLRLWLLSTLLLLQIGGVLAQDGDENRVLFINSYHRGYSWSDGIEQGFRERLDASDKKVEISYEYLDSRRFAYGSQIELMAQAMAVKYGQYHPRLIAVSDNAAFDFAIKYRDKIFPGVAIVFCGYNNFRADLIKGIPNITGVNEEVNFVDGIEMALKIHPATQTLAFVGSDWDDSSKRNYLLYEETVFPRYRSRFNIVQMKNASIAEIGQKLHKLPADTLVFIIGQTRDQGAGRALTPSENGRLVANASPFPVYTSWDLHLGTGVLGGHVLTGIEQGRAMAGLALQVLGGTPAGQIPVVMNSPASNIFDYAVMQRFHLTSSNLPGNSQIINRTPSIWQNYRWPIIIVANLILLETLSIGLLLRLMRKKHRALDDLAKERALLECRVEERTMELKEVNQQLAQLSFSDGLTRIANRRRFDEVLDTEFFRLRRSGGILSLMMIDIDYFKSYNDSHGHVLGDDCLRMVAALVASLVNRPADLAARYGGEEFAVILPETDAPGAATLAEKIRAGIVSLEIAHEASSILPYVPYVTISIGVITVNTSTIASSTNVVRLADEQLYRAKSAGRNQVVAKDLSTRV